MKLSIRALRNGAAIVAFPLFSTIALADPSDSGAPPIVPEPIPVTILRSAVTPVSP